jgi:hypothetical protein
VSLPLLVSLASVKDWLGADGKPYPSSSDVLLTRMVAAVSQFAVTYLSRPIAPATFSEVYNGNGSAQLPLRQTPVILVRSLSLGATSIAARTAQGQTGFTFDSASVYIGSGWSEFTRDAQNVQVTYDAGYQAADTLTVPADQDIEATGTSADLSRPWNSDRGVAYASTGVALTLVSVAPTVAGTYQLATNAQGESVYMFAAADIGASVAVTYGYTPEDIAQALIELVGERFKSRGRIGENSQNLGHGQVVSFSQKDMGAAVKMMLQQYRNVVPVG